MSGRRRSPQRFWLVAGGGVAAALTVGAWLLGLPLYPAWLVGASVVLFALYGFDKRRAVGSGRRVPEAVLHVLALAGGFAGGWVGRAAFRHKTRRMSFAVVLLVATVLHSGVLVYLQT